MQTLLDKAFKAGVLMLMAMIQVVIYMISVCNMLRYSRPEDGNPVLALAWGGISLMLFIGMIITFIGAIHIMPRRKY